MVIRQRGVDWGGISVGGGGWGLLFVSLSLNKLEGGLRKKDMLSSEFWNSCGMSMTEILNCEMVFKTVFVDSSESMRGELMVNDGKGEEVKLEREIREDWR